jgi:hypothetical protein
LLLQKRLIKNIIKTTFLLFSLTLMPCNSYAESSTIDNKKKDTKVIKAINIFDTFENKITHYQCFAGHAKYLTIPKQTDNTKTYTMIDDTPYRVNREFDETGIFKKTDITEIDEDDLLEIMDARELSFDKRGNFSPRKKAVTWCNFVVFSVAKIYGVDKNFWGQLVSAHDLRMNLINNKYPGFKEVDAETACKKALDGKFVIAIIPDHVAIISGGYEGDDTYIGNMKIFQGGMSYGHMRLRNAFKETDLEEIKFFVYKK